MGGLVYGVLMVLGFLDAPMASHSSCRWNVPSLVPWGLLSWALQRVSPQAQGQLDVLTEVPALGMEATLETMEFSAFPVWTPVKDHAP